MISEESVQAFSDAQSKNKLTPIMNGTIEWKLLFFLFHCAIKKMLNFGFDNEENISKTSRSVLLFCFPFIYEKN